MKLALLGASGFIGSHILTEALARGHDVLGITRSPQSVFDLPRYTGLQLGHASAEGYARGFPGNDVVISATKFLTLDLPMLLDGVRRAGVSRLVMVGGAGSLLLPDGRRVIDSPSFPEEYRAEATAGAECLQHLRSITDLDWSFLSPSAEIFPGPKQGGARLGADHLLVDAKGRSSISAGDYAAALLDEVEHPTHVRKRFTVGY